MIDWPGKPMSEAALASVAAQHKRWVPARTSRNRLNPLEALERGFTLFQSTFSQDAWRYYAGAAPLVLCFVPMWVADGQIHMSKSALLTQAAALAGAYLLRVRMIASYMQRIRERAFGVPVSKTAGVAAKLTGIGRLLAWKITLSAAALAALPTIAGASWFYSACQFASLEAREDTTERHSFGGCLALGGQWFGGGLLFFVMLLPLWIAAWLNGFLLAIIVPQLLHSIFGVNTLLSTEMGADALFRSSAFWLSLFAGTWVALDPIVKCTYVVVYQHLRSRREGDDLRGLLAILPREQQKKAEIIASTRAMRSVKIGAAVVVAATLLSACHATNARAAQAPLTKSSTETFSDSAQPAKIQKLRRALDEESQREIYRWHDADHPTPPTWFDKLLAKIGHAIQRAWSAIWNFLSGLWPRGLNFSGDGKGDGWRMKDLRLWLALIATLTLAVGVVLFWLRRRGAAQLSIPIAADRLPDPIDTAVASERSEDEWFALANRLEGEGELRLALRAAYLGLLAGLAQREWLTIRRDRTNREYLDEFTRRWRRRPQAVVEARTEVPEKLRGSLRVFDLVWYGSHALTPAAVAAYRQGQRELLGRV
jgi:Domain of unknown function (DUF4129)